MLERLTVLPPRDVPLGGPRSMTVRRTLPASETSLVGAWCFIDHFGPDDVGTTGGMRVARHPHTGLATVSWLFDGAIIHRDSIGSHVLVRPGSLDMMIAGRGITHSEFSSPDTTVLHGVQLWFALPDAVRDGERDFVLSTPDALRGDGVALRVGLGSVQAVDAAGAELADASEVPTPLPLTLVEIALEPGASVRIALDGAHEHALQMDRGTVSIACGTETAEASDAQLVLLPDGAKEITVTADGRGARLLLLGGEPLGEDILMWWNFVGRAHEEIAAFREEYMAEIAADASGSDESPGRFGPWPARTPAAFPAPEMPALRLRPRGRAGLVNGDSR